MRLSEGLLQLLFSAFPGGLPGTSLLVMRAVVGIAIIIQGGTYFGQAGGSLIASLIGAAALISGVSLVLGLFTPFSAVLAGLDLIGEAASAIPAATLNLFSSQPALIFALTLIVAIIGLGPGRFSIDARLFGRREIIIPPPPSHLER